MLNIPKKKQTTIGEDTFQHAVVIDAEKTLRFARVRELLGGYSNQEILEILITEAIKSYDDGNAPDVTLLPKKLQQQINGNAPKEESSDEE